jgi:cell division protein FtsQ
VVLTLGVVLLLATGGRGAHLIDATGRAIDGRFGAMGFRVDHVKMDGASPYAQQAILAAMGVNKGDPILGLDLKAMRDRVQTVGWIETAEVARLLPDTLAVRVVERPRLAVWQHRGRTEVIDAKGAVIPGADPGLFASLPLVVGEGAGETAAAILPLVQSRPRLMERTEALVRVDARRWDLRLKDGAIIQLPESHEDQALIQLDQLDRRARLLELGFERIDLRDPDTVAVRPRQKGEPAGA